MPATACFQGDHLEQVQTSRPAPISQEHGWLKYPGKTDILIKIGWTIVVRWAINKIWIKALGLRLPQEEEEFTQLSLITLTHRLDVL
jgi:hypothetical protein